MTCNRKTFPLFRIVKINKAVERVRVSNPERALRLPDLVSLLEQRKKKEGEKKKTMRKGTFFQSAVIVYSRKMQIL